MAFYQKTPQQERMEKRKRRFADWSEEGTRYQKKPSRQTSSSGKDHRRSNEEGASPRGYSRDQKFHRDYNDQESFRRRSPGKESTRRTDLPRRQEGEQEARSVTYQDYEYRREPSSIATPLQEETQSNILTGRNPIREALKQDRDFEKLLVQRGELSGSAREIVAAAKEKHVMVQVVDKSRLDEIAPHHQGLIAFVSAYAYSTVDDILSYAEERQEEPFLILLDGITDPHNLGAIIRTAECAGAHGVIVPMHRSVGLTPAAVKASAGAIEHIRVARVVNLNRTIEELQKKHIWVYALSMDGEDYEQMQFEGGTALVIGAEGEGISHLTEEKCDQCVSLPMRGHIDSLNASVAAGIMMYHVLGCRRRNGR